MNYSERKLNGPFLLKVNKKDNFQIRREITISRKFHVHIKSSFGHGPTVDLCYSFVCKTKRF